MMSSSTTAVSSSLRRLILLSSNTKQRNNCNNAAIIRRTLTSSTKPTASPTSSSSSSSLLAGDAGHKATHLHHHMTTLLVFATPLYLFALPESYTASIIDKGCGLVIAGTISAHSWIGLNYVATDYVPKISKSLLGPARVLNLALGAVTFAGLSKIAMGERGLRGTVMGLWRPAEAETTEAESVETKK